MPAEHGFRFDDLQRVENVGSHRVHAGKSQRSMLEKAKRPGDLRRSTFSWRRSTRSSAERARARAPFTISAPNRPICSVRSVPSLGREPR